jgi:hypothetical protein
MKQGVKRYFYRDMERTTTFKFLLEWVQSDMRKQNQLGWYVHTAVHHIPGDRSAESEVLVVYRRDEEM